MTAHKTDFRVLIVDDSPLARSVIRSILETDPGIEVVGEAVNGQEGIEQAWALRPSLITMDLKMPVMDGVEAIAEIMCANPVPILVVSSIADAKEACEAIAHGALDAVVKPEMDEESAAAFIAKVKMLSGIKVITHLRPRPQGSQAIMKTAEDSPPGPQAKEPDARPIFAIATSTGGPQALAYILGELPADFPCPVLISQHIADGFAGGMSDWLSTTCKLPVLLAKDGADILGGYVYLSPSELNLSVTPTYRIALLARQAGEIYHPTCDVLLSSVAAVFGTRSIGIILTGMGHDGAEGMAKIQAAGGTTVAQDEASSVIFGMNQVAIKRGVIGKVAALKDIPACMIRLAQGRSIDGAK